MTQAKRRSNVMTLFDQIDFPKFLFFGGILLTICGVAFSLILPLEVRTFVDSFKTHFSAHSVILIVAMLIGSTVFDMGGGYVLGVAGQRIVSQLRSNVSAHIVTLPIPFFDSHRSAEVASHVSSDTEKINDLISGNVSTLVSGLLLTVGSVIILFTISPLLTAIIIGALGLMGAVIAPISKKQVSLYHKTQNQLGKYNADLQQSIAEIRLIKTSDAEPAMIKILTQRIHQLYRTNLRITLLNALIDPIEFTILMGTIFFVFIAGGAMVSRGAITIGTLTSFLIYVFQILTPIANVGTTLTEFRAANGAAQTLTELLDESGEATTTLSADVPATSSAITFDHVNFSYQTGNDPTINDLSLTIAPRKTTAFVGPSGGGKSTILSLIERFYHLDSGTITYAGRNVQDIPLPQWRASISYVSQETSMLFGTIRDNLVFGLTSTPDDDTINQALASAAALDFVNDLPAGLDTELAEQAQNLSGGQIQRLMIARAFLRPAPIIILDEATASLDSASEQSIEDAIERLQQTKTIIIVAHRLATVKNADTIFFIEKGAVTGSGTHQSLIATHPLYRQYVEEQLV
ncbi:ABC transporter ATP-binding protein [Levilactobacillus fujinensis]|uniref:ABC transporter ATP-binding protein n=1 Tax=Levilactobacillus fujinensis TaxID=2486024 RepID=A0ABW1THF6_9LACO|nr:ABC transporter ATP-binding protein [Levilactobacillus fujinensis]